MAEDSDRTWLDSMSKAYDRWLVPAVFLPFACDLARRAALHRPANILEIAAGTGALTRELMRALPSPGLVATDFNAAMVDFASQRVRCARRLKRAWA